MEENKQKLGTVDYVSGELKYGKMKMQEQIL